MGAPSLTQFHRGKGGRPPTPAARFPFPAEQLRKLRQRKFHDVIRKRKMPNFLDEFLGMPLGELDKSGGEK
jgi:hypothetical protein